MQFDLEVMLNMQKLRVAGLISVILALFCYTAYAVEKDIYVSPTGADVNEGTISEPLKNLEAARIKARLIKETGIAEKVNIILREGEYNLSKSFILNEFDSNTSYSAYNDEKVVLKGSITLDNSKFREITDNEALSHFPNSETAKKVKVYNLNRHEIELLNMNYRGNYNPSWIVKTNNPQELIVNGEKQTIARWPNSGFAEVKGVTDVGDFADELTSRGFTFKTEYSGVRHWDKAENAMIYGLFSNGWTDQTYKILNTDANDDSVTTVEPSRYTPVSGGMYYVFNLLEELDREGEYYIDSEKGMLYFYPYENSLNGKIEITNLLHPLMRITDAKNITVSGIEFVNSNGSGINIENCDNVNVKNCSFKNLGKGAVGISNSYNCGIDSAVIDNVIGGVTISNCGDMQNLTNGNCYVSNTKISNFQNATYTAAITISGVGNRASNNEISDGDHLAIQFYGNEHVIEYNDIHDVLRCTSDAGVIYSGQTWTSRGNAVRYNYIHDIKNEMKIGYTLIALYFDDGFCSADVYGNIIENFPGIGIYVSGRDFNVYNNLIVNSSGNAVYARQRYSDSTDITTLSGYKSLLTSPYKDDLWKSRYPKLFTILDEEPLKPYGNSIYNNLSVGKGIFNFEDVIVEKGIKTEPNMVNDSVLLDENYQIPEASEVFTILKGFENIPFEEIGIK